MSRALTARSDEGQIPVSSSFLIADSEGKLIQGVSTPSIGSEPHWAKLRALRASAALYPPFQKRVERAIELRIGRGDTVLDSSQVGAEVLSGLPAGWFGDFNREFRGLQAGDASGICGMEIYSQLKVRKTDDWQPLTKIDPRGIWDTMLYARI